MPYAINLSFPASLIQSVVQAGESTVTIFALPNPCRDSAALISALIISIAGQPLYVGVITISGPSAVSRTSLIMPRSTTDNTGISGSFTDSSRDHIVLVSSISYHSQPGYAR